MAWIWILFFVSFVLSWAIARYVRRRAISIYQKKNTAPQTKAVRIMPEGAGLSIVVTWFASCAFLTIYKEFMPLELFMAMAPGLLLVAAVLLDEVYHFPSYFRLVVNAAVVAAGMYFLGGVNKLELGNFVWNTPVAHIVMNVVAFFVLLWLITVFRNFNATGGKEGNLASVSVFICIFAIVLSAKHNPIFFLIPCLVGFLVGNFHPARYLLGEAAASFLGYVFGVMGTYYQSSFVPKESEGMHFYLFLLICLVPIFDVTYTAIRRLFVGENPASPTQQHLYQRLLNSGFSHTKVIVTQIFLCFLMAILASLYLYYNNISVALVLGGVALLLMFIYTSWVGWRFAFGRVAK